MRPLPLEILFTLLVLLLSTSQANANEATSGPNGHLSSSPRIHPVKRFGYFSYSRNPGTGSIPPFNPLIGVEGVLLYKGSSTISPSTASQNNVVSAHEANINVNVVLDDESKASTHVAMPMPTFRGDSLPSMLFGDFDPSPPNASVSTSTFDGNASSAMGMGMGRLHSDKVLWAGTSHAVHKRWQGHGEGEDGESYSGGGGGEGRGYSHRPTSESGEGSDGEHGGWAKHGSSVGSGSEAWSGKDVSSGGGEEEKHGGQKESGWKNKSDLDEEDHSSSWKDAEEEQDGENAHYGSNEESSGSGPRSGSREGGSDSQGSRGRKSSDETGEDDGGGGWHRSSSKSGSGSTGDADGQWQGSQSGGTNGNTNGNADDGQWHPQSSSSSSSSAFGSGQRHGSGTDGPRGASAWRSGASNGEQSPNEASNPEDSYSSADDSGVDPHSTNDMTDAAYHTSAATTKNGLNLAEGDCVRLTSFYRTMFSSTSSGGRWTNSKGWDQGSDEEMGCCNWYGVTCDPTTKRVTGIKLQNNGLQAGSVGLGKDLFELDQLMRLDLSSNTLLSISDDFLSLSHLTHLNLSSCSISGMIPTTLSSHLQMINLDLSHNSFDGDIQLSTPNLVSVDLSHNILNGIHLTGTGKLSKLILGNNGFTGALDDWSGVTSLSSIDISYNNTGPLFDISQLTNLKHLDARSNSLSGTIPSPPPSLTSLYLSSNNFSLLPVLPSTSTSIPAPTGLVSCYILPQPLLSCPTSDELQSADNQSLISECHLNSCSKLASAAAAAAAATSTSIINSDQIGGAMSLPIPSSMTSSSNKIPVYPLPGENLGDPGTSNVNTPYPVPAQTGDVLPPLLHPVPVAQNPNIVTPQGIRPRPGTANALGLSALSSTSQALHSYTITSSFLIVLVASVSWLL